MDARERTHCQGPRSKLRSATDGENVTDGGGADFAFLVLAGSVSILWK